MECNSVQTVYLAPNCLVTIYRQCTPDIQNKAKNGQKLMKNALLQNEFQLTTRIIHCFHLIIIISKQTCGFAFLSKFLHVSGSQVWHFNGPSVLTVQRT